MVLKESKEFFFDERPWHRYWPEKVPKNISYPNESLGELFTTSVEKHPNRVALIYFDKHITYWELDKLSNQFARALAEMDVDKGDRVALLLPNIPQFVISFYGIVKIGAIVTALNPIDMVNEIEQQLADSGAEVIVTLDLFYSKIKDMEKTNLKRVIITSLSDYMPKSKAVLGTILGKIPSSQVQPAPNLFRFKDLISGYEDTPYQIVINPDDVAAIQYTGGTTGTPKGAMLTHMNLLSNTIMCAKWIGTDEEASYLSILPFFHSYGLMTGLMAALYIGAKVVLFPKFDPKQVLQSIEKYKIIVFCGVPTIYSKLLTDPDLMKYNYSSLRYCISGSDTLTQDLKDRFTDVFGSIIVEGYGLTEASPITHCNPLESAIEYKFGSIGIPFPDTDAKIVDLDDGETILKKGEIGELAVKGPQIMKGYLNRPEETQMALKDGWLFTGDICKMDEDGYFFLKGRKKDLIKYKGYSVYPRELEELLSMHPAIKLCSIVGKPDPVAGEIPKAYVVLTENASLSEKELMNFVNEKVASYKAIREVEFRNDLPTNFLGKVQKRELLSKINK